LYVAPESLRYKTIRKILNNRFISRIVIDEAHCLSTWGQDFRPDYRYIAPFIKNELKQKNIPISCLTATASKAVIDDINDYFESNLNIQLKQFIASNKRKNLCYSVKKVLASSEKQKDIHTAKYNEILNILDIDIVPAIIYIPTSTQKCNDVANQLTLDTNFTVMPFHSKVEELDYNREQILYDFIDNESDNHIDIIVATTAFGTTCLAINPAIQAPSLM